MEKKKINIKILSFLKEKKEQIFNKESNYISAKESAKISRKNRKITNQIEKQRKRRNIPENEYITQMKNAENVVEFDNVHTYFFTDIGTVKAVDGVTFDVPYGKTVGVVGEIRFNSGEKVYNVVKTPERIMQTLRGNDITMIFQEPMTTLNPVFRIGAQVEEVLLLHNKDMTKEQAKEKTIALLELVGIANSERVYRNFPHELSGGMRQRVVIAMALACDPKLIIADEPTTALDVTIQAQILGLLSDIKGKINSSIMLITHDLGVIAEMADYVVVMYAGRVIEKGTAKEIFKNPAHPYTVGLMRSKPVVGRKVERLYNIPGNVPNPINMPNYCYFKDRCEKCIEACNGDYPPEFQLSETHFVSCYLYDPQLKEGESK